MSSQAATPKVPKLRFPEFSEKWEERNLEMAIDSIDSGWSPQCLGRSAQLDEWGVLATTSTTWDGFSDAANKALPEGLEARPALEVQSGDVLVTRAGPFSRVGVVAHVNKSRPKLMLSDKLIRVRASSSHDSRFLATLLGRPRYQSYISGTKSGLAEAQVNITQDILKKGPVVSPSRDEQQKIAGFLGAVDARVELLRRRREALQAYKKGMMQRLFSQDLRFTRDDGSPFPDWQKRRLGDLLIIGSGRDYRHLRAGKYPVYGTGGYMTSVDEYLYDGDSVCIGRKGTINAPSFLTGRFWTVDTLFFTHGFKGVIPLFVLAIFQRINWLKHNEASGVPSLSKTTIERIKVQVPALGEQKKIADFLSTLDAKINAVTAQLDAMQHFKKALLQQMFV